jgi:hypothetical protein
MMASRDEPTYQDTGSGTSPCDRKWKPAVKVDGSTSSRMVGNRGIIWEKTVLSSIRAKAAPTQ